MGSGRRKINVTTKFEGNPIGSLSKKSHKAYHIDCL